MEILRTITDIINTDRQLDYSDLYRIFHVLTTIGHDSIGKRWKGIIKLDEEHGQLHKHILLSNTLYGPIGQCKAIQ